MYEFKDESKEVLKKELLWFAEAYSELGEKYEDILLERVFNRFEEEIEKQRKVDIEKALEILNKPVGVDLQNIFKEFDM